MEEKFLSLLCDMLPPDSNTYLILDAIDESNEGQLDHLFSILGRLRNRLKS